MIINLFRRFIPCTCYDHGITVEAQRDTENEIMVKWWSSAGYGDENMGLWARIIAAIRIFKDGPYPVHDVTLTPETVDQMIDALMEARNVAGEIAPYQDAEYEEKIRAIKAIEDKYAKLREKPQEV